ETGAGAAVGAATGVAAVAPDAVVAGAGAEAAGAAGCGLGDAQLPSRIPAVIRYPRPRMPAASFAGCRAGACDHSTRAIMSSDRRRAGELPCGARESLPDGGAADEAYRGRAPAGGHQPCRG